MKTKILIIGKEAEIDISKSDVQYEMEIKKNKSFVLTVLKKKVYSLF